MRIVSQLCTAGLIAGFAGAALANGGGAMPSGMPSLPRQQSPQAQAREAYNEGVRYVKKGDKAQEYAAAATDAGKKDKATREAQQAYGEALARFKLAVGLEDSAEGWNYAGYTSRKLGHYEEALSAYEKALTLKPGYADALEYRAEAYLGLARIPEAQQSYLDLYAGNRALAGKLLTAMKRWSSAQRALGAGTTNLDELDQWIQERERIAGQTAALTRAGTAALWR